MYRRLLLTFNRLLKFSSAVLLCLATIAWVDLCDSKAQGTTPQTPTQQIVLLGHEPTADAIIGQRQPAIRVRLAGGGLDLDPTSIVFDIDNIDVSTQVKLDRLGAVYVPLSKLKGGVHTVRFLAKTRDGFEVPSVEWSFTIKRFAKIYEAGGLGTHSANVERFTVGELESDAKRYRADANFALNYNLLRSALRRISFF